MFKALTLATALLSIFVAICSAEPASTVSVADKVAAVSAWVTENREGHTENMILNGDIAKNLGLTDGSDLPSKVVAYETKDKGGKIGLFLPNGRREAILAQQVYEDNTRWFWLVKDGQITVTIANIDGKWVDVDEKTASQLQSNAMYLLNLFYERATEK